MPDRESDRPPLPVCSTRAAPSSPSTCPPKDLRATTAAAEDAGTGKRLTTAVLDISDEVAVGNEVATAINALDGLDVLVNAAAIQLCAHTHEHTLHDWNTTLAINLTGTFLMTRQRFPR